MPADVLLWRLPATPGAELAPPDPTPGLRALMAALAGDGRRRAAGTCAVKVHLGSPGRPSAIAPAWAREVARGLGRTPAAGHPVAGGTPGSFATDTLSIATRGLDTAESLRAVAQAKGFTPDLAAGTALPFVVGDDPAGPPPVDLAAAAPAGRDAAAGSRAPHLAGALANVTSLGVLAPVRPHPHLGLVGAVATLGLELVTREAKLDLHRGIRPQVDTPLCAGCGSCLDVCLYDAIVFRGGRATIDHRLCTGCGECMGVCFMAGIAPEDAAGLGAFAEAVASSAGAVVGHLGRVGCEPPLFLNALVQIDAPAPAGRSRRLPLAGIGFLASRDPVAVDAAAFDLLYERLGGRPSSRGGFPQEPGALLEAAEGLGLGCRNYRLREVGAAPEFLD